MLPARPACVLPLIPIKSRCCPSNLVKEPAEGLPSSITGQNPTYHQARVKRGGDDCVETSGAFPHFGESESDGSPRNDSAKIGSCDELCPRISASAPDQSIARPSRCQEDAGRPFSAPRSCGVKATWWVGRGRSKNRSHIRAQSVSKSELGAWGSSLHICSSSSARTSNGLNRSLLWTSSCNAVTAVAMWPP